MPYQPELFPRPTLRLKGEQVRLALRLLGLEELLDDPPKAQAALARHGFWAPLSAFPRPPRAGALARLLARLRRKDPALARQAAEWLGGGP